MLHRRQPANPCPCQAPPRQLGFALPELPQLPFDWKWIAVAIAALVVASQLFRAKKSFAGRIAERRRGKRRQAESAARHRYDAELARIAAKYGN